MRAGMRASCLRAALVAGAVVAISACTVGPNYVRPATTVPAAYKEAGSQAAPRGDTAPIAANWWSVYNDPVLDGLMAQVKLGNQSLAAAAARVQEAQALVQVAKGASVPTVGLGSLKSGRKNENDFGLGISWELDLWGRVRRDVEAHRAMADASAADLAGATLSVQAQLAQAYFALRADDALLVVTQRAVDANEQSNRMVQNQYAQGLLSNADVADSLMHYTAAQLALADTKAQRAQLEHAMAVMLGKQPAEFSIAPAPFVTQVPDVPAGVPATLLERRPDVRASERRMAAANARIGVAKAETLPTISLAAGIGVIRGPTGTVDARAPLFTGGRLTGQVNNADAGYTEAVANYRQTVLDAFREVEDGLVISGTLAGNAALQAKATAAATESDRVVRNQYNEGVADYTAVVASSGAALDATRADVQLRQRRLDASVNLIKALGGGWQGTTAPAAPAAAKPR